MRITATPFHFSQQKRTGFTLIELMVVVSISIILMGSAMAGFINFRARQQVLADAKDVQQLIRSAQVKARLQDVPDVVAATPTYCHSDSSRLQGYRVKFSSATALSLVPLCGGTLATATEQTASSTLTVANSTLSIASVSLPQNFSFYTLQRGTNIPSDRVVTLTGSGYKYCFTVGVGGSVSEVTNQGC